jgi:transposase
VPVLAPGQAKTKTGRLWTYVRDDRPPGDTVAPAVWFAHSPDCKGEHHVQNLEKFLGTLQADDYAGFNQLYEDGRIEQPACWTHVRHHFYNLEQAHSSSVAREAMQRIGALYGIEEEIRGKPLDQLRGVRQTQSKPLLDSLRQWLEATLSKLSRKSTATRASNERIDALYRNRHIEIDQQRRRTLSARPRRASYLFPFIPL